MLEMMIMKTYMCFRQVPDLKKIIMAISSPFMKTFEYEKIFKSVENKMQA